MIRLVIIGPVEPFRSGVARHTSALARALSRHSELDLRVYSFSRQYPKSLFPGESDRSDDIGAPEGIDVRYSIDALNPVTWLTAARDICRFRPALVVVPSWTFFLAPCLGFIMRYVRQRSIKVATVVHNVVDHETSRWKAALSAFQIRQADAYLTHTRELADGIRQLLPEAQVRVCFHPVFDYPPPTGRLPKRADLELLMFGLVRPYKGVDILLGAMARIEKRSVMLSIVGEMWQDAEEIRSMVQRLGLGARVEIVPRYVPDSEAAEFFERADVVALPYRSVTGSGVLPLSFYYGKPVIASRLPGFLELIEEDRTGWTVPTGDLASWATALQEKVDRRAALAMRQDIERVRAELSFDRFARVLLEVCGIQTDAEFEDRRHSPVGSTELPRAAG